MHRSSSTNSKTFVVVASPLEYIRKQQVANPERTELNFRAATFGESAELDRGFRHCLRNR